MEEILASIRRIISEDEPAAEAAPAEAPAPEPMAAEAMPMEAEEVLELTDPLPEPEPEPVETHGDLEVHQAEPEPEPEIEPMPEPVMAAAAYDEPLVSDPTADQTASSFGQLARSVAMPKAGRNLEDVVGELLRPLLKAWLDEHLPTIVQAKVEEEVERIARRRIS